MLTVNVIDRKRNVIDKIDVNAALFQGPINRLLVSDAIRAQLANLREGNAATKTRSEVNFTNKKIYRQKGTGRARHASRKAPIFVGGGTVFGPHPRDFSITLPQKMRKLALLSLLRLKWKQGKILVAGDLQFKAPKTKDAVGYFKDLAVSEAVVVLDEKNEPVQKSIRNMPRFHTTLQQGLRLLDLARSDYVVFTPEALRGIEERVLGK